MPDGDITIFISDWYTKTHKVSVNFVWFTDSVDWWILVTFVGFSQLLTNAYGETGTKEGCWKRNRPWSSWWYPYQWTGSLSLWWGSCSRWCFLRDNKCWTRWLSAMCMLYLVYCPFCLCSINLLKWTHFYNKFSVVFQWKICFESCNKKFIF